MNDPISSSILIAETPIAAPRLFERVGLWTLATLGGLATGALMIFAVATQSSADAERIGGGASYAETLVGALAAAQGRRAP